MIRLVGVNKEYHAGDHTVRAVQDLNLNIPDGSYVAIMGPSGSGKSSLLNILGCLDRVTTGEYYLGGTEVSQLTDDQLAKIRNQKIGFVFQNFNLLPTLNAVENVALPLLYAGITEGYERARQALTAVGLEHRIDHRPMEMSGGERQRVAIARAIVARPGLILADEPTGALDTRTTEEILQIFADLHLAGTTLVVITHEEDVAAHAERIIRFRDGKIVSDKHTRERRHRSPVLEGVSDDEIDNILSQDPKARHPGTLH